MIKPLLSQNARICTRSQLMSYFPARCHEDQLPERNHMPALPTAAHVFSVGIECSAAVSTVQRETAPIGHLCHFPLDDCEVWRKYVHTCQFRQTLCSHAAHQLVLHSLEKARVWKAVFWQWHNCPLLPQRRVAFIFTSGMEKSLRHNGKSFL